MLRITAPAIGIAAALAAACTSPAAPGEPEFSADRIKAHVTFLADDALEGREAGTRGHEIAARYIASQFALEGLKGGGEGGSYFQSVQLLEGALSGGPATVVVRTPRGAETLTHGLSAFIRGPLAGGSVAVDGPLVFVGYGMQDAAMGFNDYEGLDVRGRIPVVLSGSPKGMNSEIGAHLKGQQLKVAADHGAAAVLFVNTRAAAAAFPWERVVEVAHVPDTTWVRKDGTPFDSANGIKASAVIDPAVAPLLFEGAPKSLTQVLDEADATGGRPKGFALSSTAQLTVATRVRRYSSPEVIGVIPGSDPVLKDEYIVLMGHADHIGMNPAGEGDRINNGALDNAAGVAMLIEVARAFATSPSKPRRSILFIANTAEEKGLLGAEYFAHNPTVPIDRITAAIDLDMPLLLYDFTDAVAYGADHSTLKEVFQRAGAAMGVTLSPDPMPEQAVFVRSDHYSMAKAGVPAVMLATGMANGGKAAWDSYLTKTYHHPTDDLSQPIVWSAGARFAELNYRVVRALADADGRAQWYAKDYFGDLFAPKAAKAAKPAGK